MWREDSAGDLEAGDVSAPGLGGGWSSWRLSGENLTLLVGGVAGGALIVMLVVAAVIWRLCVLRRDKQYRMRMGECGGGGGGGAECRPPPVQPVMPSESAVFASPSMSGRWAYSSRLLGPSPASPCESTPPAAARHGPQAWVYGDSVQRSVSLHFQEAPCGPAPAPAPGPAPAAPRPRPLSANCSPATPRHANLPPPPLEFLMPEICEFHPGAAGGSSSELRTRSLPSSARARGQDPDPLYAKVNFSKKRKNRMRNDEAAIIAISKSRSQFLDKAGCSPDDTDTLVDNEAVIVYNERTAL